MCPEPIQNNPQETPFFPYLLVMVNSETYFLLATAPVMDYANHPEEIVDHLLENFVKQKWRPEEFLVRDDRTYELLEELAEKLNIPIAIDDDLPALDDVEDDMLNEFGASAQEDYQEIMKMLVSILQLDDAAIQTMPPELIRQLEMMLDDGIVPPELADALTKKLGL
jgi:Tfp pilus assembly protein FimV